MDNKSIWPTLTKKILDESKNKTGLLGKLANVIANPGNPEKIINLAKDVISAGFKQLKKNEEELRQFEQDAFQTRKEVDNLEQMVQANWLKIRKCGSDEEYLREEEQVAQLLEEKLCKQQQKHLED